MSEPIWRSQPDSPVYMWAVIRRDETSDGPQWELLHQINGKHYDVADEWGIDMGTPDLVRAAITEAIEENNGDECKGLVQDLLSDLKKLEAQ